MTTLMWQDYIERLKQPIVRNKNEMRVKVKDRDQWARWTEDVAKLQNQPSKKILLRLLERGPFLFPGGRDVEDSVTVQRNRTGSRWVGWRNESQQGEYLEILFQFDDIRKFTAMHLYTNHFVGMEVEVRKSLAILF
ncbi:unnamed protein product [Nezara viridula]|uniref:Discoidin domain-containing protein n=1 Tax=Nezara viridula TaxID=85310 RepID=A0A9P0EE80_NEZVI|nr:unnamed protein product [Nezara viridula]